MNKRSEQTHHQIRYTDGIEAYEKILNIIYH